MAHYRPTKIVTEDFDGVLCEVKYLDVSTEQEFKKTFGNLVEDSYEIVRHNRHSAYLMHAFDRKDIVVLNCLAPIKVAWIRVFFPDYFRRVK